MPTATQSPLQTLLVNRWEELSNKIVELVKELPGGKIDWAPFKDGRTYGAVLRHIAFWNRHAAAILTGKPADGAANELPYDKYATKQQALDAVVTTSAEVLAALRLASDQAVVETLVPYLEHQAEHYGQLAVYARLMGVTPPASRA